MEKFRFYLDIANYEIVRPYLEAAEQAYSDGSPGCILCQVKRDWTHSPGYIVGNFIPESYTLRILEIIKEWESSQR